MPSHANGYAVSNVRRSAAGIGRDRRRGSRRSRRRPRTAARGRARRGGSDARRVAVESWTATSAASNRSVAAGRLAVLDQVARQLLLPVDDHAPCRSARRSRCGAARRRPAARCPRGRGRRDPSARRRRRRGSAARRRARARPRGRGRGSSRGCAARGPPTRCPPARAAATSSRPGGPAPTMATWVCSGTARHSDGEEGRLAGALQPDVEAQGAVRPAPRPASRAPRPTAAPSTGSVAFAVGLVGEVEARGEALQEPAREHAHARGAAPAGRRRGTRPGRASR